LENCCGWVFLECGAWLSGGISSTSSKCSFELSEDSVLSGLGSLNSSLMLWRDFCSGFGSFGAVLVVVGAGQQFEKMLEAVVLCWLVAKMLGVGCCSPVQAITAWLFLLVANILGFACYTNGLWKDVSGVGA
jgi:hypothetical protein